MPLIADSFSPQKSKGIISVIAESHSGVQIPRHCLVFSSCWLGLLNEQSSLLTEEAPVLALLHLVSHACTENCLYNDKCLHESEMRYSGGLIHGCQICKIRKKQNAEFVEMSNYLLEPSVKK